MKAPSFKSRYIAEIARCHRYTVTEEDGQFIARCLYVDVTSDGPTQAEAVANLREALVIYFHRDES